MWSYDLNLSCVYLLLKINWYVHIEYTDLQLNLQQIFSQSFIMIYKFRIEILLAIVFLPLSVSLFSTHDSSEETESFDIATVFRYSLCLLYIESIIPFLARKARLRADRQKFSPNRYRTQPNFGGILRPMVQALSATSAYLRTSRWNLERKAVLS